MKKKRRKGNSRAEMAEAREHRKNRYHDYADNFYWAVL